MLLRVQAARLGDGGADRACRRDRLQRAVAGHALMAGMLGHELAAVAGDEVVAVRSERFDVGGVDADGRGVAAAEADERAAVAAAQVGDDRGAFGDRVVGGVEAELGDLLRCHGGFLRVDVGAALGRALVSSLGCRGHGPRALDHGSSACRARAGATHSSSTARRVQAG
ncbi:MAG TPA: hypothetical protein VFX13_11110 [Gaiellales bacterium]|nr:hypothetical protein [Gaiellales bacterium]